jgi:predicted amidohydrolase
MSHFGIAGLQLELSAGDNLDLIAREVRFTKTVFPWVKMIVLSELCSYGADIARAAAQPSAAYEFYANLAKEHAIYLVAGSLFERRDEQTYNVTLVFDPEGGEVARYAKMYPFKPYEEGVTPGEDFCVFDVPGAGRFGVSICYDMWFPETTRTLAWMGAEVILHPTMTGTLDRDAELAIARASAVTNQVYFFDINGAGALGNGRSTIVDPEGKVLHQASSGREVMPIEVNFDQLRRSRERGLMNLGQPLKSFRDHWRAFPPYQPGAQSEALDALGKLEKPRG